MAWAVRSPAFDVHHLVNQVISSSFATSVWVLDSNLAAFDLPVLTPGQKEPHPSPKRSPLDKCCSPDISFDCNNAISAQSLPCFEQLVPRCIPHARNHIHFQDCI